MEGEGEKLYCLCRKPADDVFFMIECDVCEDWFHGRCVGVLGWEADNIDTFVCPGCSGATGKATIYINQAEKGETVGSLSLKLRERRRVSYAEDPDEASSTDTTVDYAARLARKTFLPPDEVVNFLESGEELHLQDLYSTGFRKPYIIRNQRGLGLQVPDGITLQDVVEVIGPEYPINVISVGTQSTLPQQVSLRDWYYYMQTPPQERQGIYNVISLEFSHTRLASRIKPPEAARQLDLLATSWPASREAERPKVSRYCLTGVKNAYTDFHIDFGGTSVWYHIVKGKKIFYLVEPTSENSRAFREWSSTPDQTKVFFGDMVDKCYRLEINQGETLLLPSGWIHGVFTPEDSLVFGGNYLSELFLNMQLRVSSMEEELGVKEVFRYPRFMDVYWYCANRLAAEGLVSLKRVQHVRGWRSLLRALRKWANTDRCIFPAGINPENIIRRLEAVMIRLGIRIDPPELKGEDARQGPPLKLSLKKETKVEQVGLRMKVSQFIKAKEEAVAPVASVPPPSAAAVRPMEVPSGPVNLAPIKRMSTAAARIPPTAAAQMSDLPKRLPPAMGVSTAAKKPKNSPVSHAKATKPVKKGSSWKKNLLKRMGVGM